VVDESLKKKLKCLIFIPILSQTYCDENSFAWQHEFLAFNKMARADELGMNVTLATGNVASRILPVRIHDIDEEDKQLFENTTGSPLRSIDFIYKESGVNRSLKPADDKNDNLEKTSYRNQMNKVAHALKDIGTSILKQNIVEDNANVLPNRPNTTSTIKAKNYLFAGFIAILALLLGYWGYSKLYFSTETPITEDKSIAVLPFTNMSADPDQDYFCDGLAEDIRYDLSQLEGLEVKARTSSFAFKDKGLDIAEIGARLGVSTLLEGSVQKSGNKLRVTAQLIKVSDGTSLWSERYDRELEDVFVIKDEIAQNIVKALSIQLSSQERENLDKINTADAKAYDFYIRGREYYDKGHEDKILLSIPLFEKAIEIDNNYALAYSGLADSYSNLYMYFDNANNNLEQALIASQKALELDSTLAETHSSRGLALSQNNQFEEAEVEFNKAIQLNPRLFDAYYEYGRACRAKGMHDKAVIQFEKAAEIEPDNYNPISFLVSAYEDLEMTDKMLKANQKALTVFIKHLELNPDDSRALYLGAGALITANKIDESLEWLERAVALNPNAIAILYNAACNYSLLGRTNIALNYLDRAVEEGFGSREWIKNDSDLDNIRNDPRFQPIVERIK